MRKVRRELMKRFLASPVDYKSVIITDHAIDLLGAIENHSYPTISSGELADKWDISVQSASTQLVKLWAKGYLEREERIHPTGGIVYRYRCTEL